MDERKKAGLKAGGVCGICILILDLVSFRYLTSDIIYILGGIGYIFYFMPGILSIHFGQKVIKNRKDAVTSILVAVSVFSIIFVIVSGTWILWSPLFFVITLILAFLFTGALSLISGLLYARYKVGISLRE